MAWFSNFSREQGTNHYTIRITSDSDGDNRGDYRHDVQFTSLVPSDENRDAGGKVFETIRFEEDADFTEFLGRDAASYLNLSDEIVAQGFTITLDVSAIDSDELLMHLPRHSIHYRADKNPRTLENISEGSIGSKITGIIGTSSDDNIIGTSLNETLRGGDGDDYLQGGGGDDILLGGAGDDIITSGSGNDTVNGGAGTDTLWYRWISAGKETTTSEALLAITEDNNYSGDYATEAAAFKALSEANSNFGGNEVTLWVDLDDGYAFSYFRIDEGVFDGAPVPDQYQEGLQKNIITNTENVTANARAGVDNNGEKIIASVILEGNADANQLIGGFGHDWIWGNGGDDRIHSKNNDDTIHGGDGGDVINAGWGDDILFGEDGADRLIGNKGQDVLHGGAGNDTLIGGQGADKFVIDLTTAGDNGSDIIEDFVKVRDKIVFVTDNGDEADLAALGVEITYTNTGSEKYSEIIDSADTSTVYAKIMNKNLTNDGYDIGDSSGYFELVSATDEIVPSEV